jgi:hypothetical protein
MDEQIIEIDIAYNDNFIEVHTTEDAELKYILKELATDSDKSFKIGNKVFWKKDVNSVSIVDHGLGFIFEDVTD